MILFSVVIPVFNGEKYIKQCLDSIFSQDFSDFEVILINDGSTDKSESIIKEYSDVHANISYQTTKNSGPYLARKKGIALSKGKYICFVDCDDVVADDYFSTLSGNISDDSDIISFDLIEEDALEIPHLIKTPIFKSVYDYRKYILDSKSNNLVSKIFKKSICQAEKLEQISSITEEDLLMQFVFADNCKTISSINKPLYVYKYRSTSTTKSEVDFNRIDIKFNSNSLRKLLEYDLKWGTRLRDKIIMNRLNYLYDFFIPIVKKYKWCDYSKQVLKYDFIDYNILQSFDLKLADRRKLFLLKPLIFKNKLKLWLRTRFYICVSKLKRK